LSTEKKIEKWGGGKSEVIPTATELTPSSWAGALPSSEAAKLLGSPPSKAVELPSPGMILPSKSSAGVKLSYGRIKMLFSQKHIRFCFCSSITVAYSIFLTHQACQQRNEDEIKSKSKVIPVAIELTPSSW